ncbi:unnamed protein product [Paramecium primaurelia]|uniref:Uncharacterized protein n=2 Tax=Paramecium TaxID=5884 RepID=A0A8S1TBJ1_9CILI|nr:unnamed protein product [Paramecium primaurelia]CAD8148977.1 unnamed protein product [Paramecium pentaurelia]
MKNRFRKTHNIIDQIDAIKEMDNETLKNQRNILLTIIIQHLFVLWTCIYGYTYIYQIYLELYLKYKITTIFVIIVILLNSDIFKHKLKKQPFSLILYVSFTFSLSFLFVIYDSNKDVQLLLYSNIFPILGLIVCSLFQQHEFEYSSVFIWVLFSQMIFITCVIFLMDSAFENAIICSSITFTYVCILIYQFKTDILYEIEEYPLIACLNSYTQIFKLLFILIEAISGEYSI